MAEYEGARERFWNHRFAAGSAVLTRAEERGELRPGRDHRLVFEALMGPLHMRLLSTREPLDDDFLDGVVDLVLSGIAPHGRRSATVGHDEHGREHVSGRRPADAGRS